MNKYYFNYNGYTFKRVNKTTARRAYLNGLDIIITPCKMDPAGPWAPGYKLNKRSREAFCLDDVGIKNDFENLLNSFIYYNCNAEAGYYPAYYIPVITDPFDDIEHYNYKYIEEA